jgi:hypothetical protein
LLPLLLLLLLLLPINNQFTHLRAAASALLHLPQAVAASH